MRLKGLLLALTMFLSMSSFAAVSIQEVGGWFESGYVTFSLADNASTYAVYYKSTSGGDYLKLDSELVRNYGTYGRADVLGITAGTYQFKVVPMDKDGNELNTEAVESGSFEAKAYDRAGFAHLSYTGVGAYQDNGQLKDGAKVIYVTSKTAKTVSCELGGTTFTGLQEIMDGCNGKYGFTPVAIRIIGTINANDMDSFGSGSEGLQIKGKGSYQEMNVTLEGVGNDAGIHGFGILMRNCQSVELRNFAVMACMDDCVSLDTDNSHCWVHNLDLFYGEAGGDSDQAKGDGTIDLKGDSQYLTISNNHFWDSGKSSLCGMTSESGPNYISYHHNWFDHSDSRHPRVRTMTVHVYNNYFDGNSKYGVGATTGSSVFVESNYYRNTNKPMMISMQGTDIAADPKGKGTFSGENGGIIKSFGNVFAEKSGNFKYVTYQENNTEFDAYEATSRDEAVPSSVKTKKGGTTYNNFDTDYLRMYVYTPDAANNVPEVVKGQYGAGRMQHGDLQWAFNNTVDDASDAVNQPLKDAVVNYKTKLVGIFGSTGGGDTPVDPDPSDPDPIVPDPTSGYVCWFTGKEASNSFYTIAGSYTDGRGEVTVNGTTYSDCLKIDSKGSVTFTIDEPMTLFLAILAKSGTPSVKVDGTLVDATSASATTISYELAAGSHVVAKGGSGENYIFYINLTPKGTTGITAPVYNAEQEDGPIYDLSGRVVRNPQRGIYIQNGKKIIVR